MKAAILTIGDEILIGQVTNSNAAWMSQRLTMLGLTVNLHLIIGDQKERIHFGLKTALENADVVLITGGLGPTLDDITLSCVSEYLKMELVFDEEWFSMMQNYFLSRGRAMPDNNRKQAYLPKDCVRLDNDCGTAPGVWIKSSSKNIFLMPGVPYEMESMMNRLILPKLAEVSKSSETQRFIYNFFTTGIGESALYAKMQEQGISFSEILNSEMECAWLPSLNGVKLRFTVSASDKSSADQKVRSAMHKISPVIEPYLYAHSEDFEEAKLEEIIGNQLKEKGLSLAFAESCTGGLVSSRVTDIAGSSAYFLGSVTAYSNQAKQTLLNVSERTLKEHGAVSEQTAREMAENVRKKFNANIGASVTGIAGPGGGSAEKPVGTVWVAVSSEKETLAKKFQFEQNRLRNKQRSSQAVLDVIFRFLKNQK